MAESKNVTHLPALNQVRESNAGFKVSPSPYNTVKLDLGVLVLLSIVVWVIQAQVTTEFYLQILILASYGLLAMLWVMRKVRAISKQLKPPVVAPSNE